MWKIKEKLPFFRAARDVLGKYSARVATAQLVLIGLTQISKVAFQYKICMQVEKDTFSAVNRIFIGFERCLSKML